MDLAWDESMQCSECIKVCWGVNTHNDKTVRARKRNPMALQNQQPSLQKEANRQPNTIDAELQVVIEVGLCGGLRASMNKSKAHRKLLSMVNSACQSPENSAHLIDGMAFVQS
jgi:hypothetical protein